MRRFPLLVVATLFCSSSVFGKSNDWPKWLGPEGNGISTEPIADAWPAGGPPKVWEQKVGLGYSSPIAVDGKIYLLSQAGNDDVLTAFDAQTGKTVWSQSYRVTVQGDGNQDRNSDNGLPLPLATPTIENGRIYSYGGGGDLVCRKLEDGSEIWRLNVLNETHEKILQWNQASSPLVTDKLVYVQGGKGGPTAVAVDKQTGKIAWQSEATTNGGYAAPIIVDVDGSQQLIVFAGDHLYGMNPQTGKTLWGVPWKTSYGVNAATPIYRDKHLFISSDYGKGAMMLTLSATGAKEDWNQDDKDMQLKFQPGILDGEYLYANSAGTLKCMHWPDGKIAWEAHEHDLRLEPGGTIVRDRDLLIALSERGKLSLVRATPSDHKLLSQVKLFDFLTTWSTPLIYRGKLYAMGKDHLVCLDISNHAARAQPAQAGGVATAR